MYVTHYVSEQTSDVLDKSHSLSSGEMNNMMSDMSSVGKLSTVQSDDLLEDGSKDLWIGLTLAILSSIFIGSSFIVKKVSLQQLGHSGRRRAGAGGYGYLTHWLWWTGLLTMGAGEGLNFVAYAFAPTALVTPLGALSVLVTALLAAHCLHEALNVLAKLGCALCLLGSTVVVIHAPHETPVSSVAQLILSLSDSVFLLYVAVVLCIVAVLLFYCSPRYGSRNVLVHLTVCSLIGSFSVLCCKTLGLVVKEGGPVLVSPVLWLSLLALVMCVSVQMVYLNKALDIFATSIVTPIYYVLFTSSVLLASALLFREWQGLGARDAIGILAGFGTTVIGVTLLHAFRDLDVSRLQLGAMLSYNSQQTGRGEPETGGLSSPSGSKSSRTSSLSDDRPPVAWHTAREDRELIIESHPALHNYGSGHNS